MKSKQYIAVRDSQSVKKYTDAINQNQNSEPNAIQRRSGFDITYHMRKEVKYTLLGTRHIPLLQHEFIARYGNDALDKKWKIRKLTSELKTRIINSQKQEYSQRTGCSIETIPEGIVNETTFTPIATSLEEYGLLKGIAELH